MNARDRGTLMYKLAAEMDTHREELATLYHTVLRHVYLCYGELCTRVSGRQKSTNNENADDESTGSKQVDAMNTNTCTFL